MRKELRKLLVTGGAGFIGSEFVRQVLGRGYEVAVVDKLTYAGDLDRLKQEAGKFKFYRVDVRDRKKIDSVIKKELPQAIIHFAAETHVDRSIVDASPFIDTNIKGTQVLLDASRKYGIKKFIQISTDEVYGEITRGRFREDSPLRPNSPYAASKAAADLLVNSFVRTHGFPALIVRPSNNYGPWQYPEKLIPLVILNASRNRKVPVYAKGLNAREWLFVSDSAKAIILILEEGKIGEVYNIGSAQERKNIDVVKTILRDLSRPVSLIEYVKDRPGHDLRYSLDCNKLKRLGWRPGIGFKEGIAKTILWYTRHGAWLKKHERKKLSIKF